MSPKLVAMILAFVATGAVADAAGSGPPVVAGAPAGEVLSRHTFSSVLMGVRMEIVLYAPDEELARTAAKEAFDRIAEIEQVASTYRGNSELSQLEKRAHAEPTPVSQDLFELLALSKQLHESTGGAFDCSVYRLARIWRRAADFGELPAPHVIENIRSSGLNEHIEIDAVHRTVYLRKPVAITLDGIAKGYAGDEALEVLETHGITSALIDLSGDVVLGDPPPGKDAWSVKLDFGDPAVASIRLKLANCAVATSGDTEQFFEIDGVRYSHIIDPRTGMACTNRTAACVVGPTGALADALATAACVLGTDEAPPIIGSFEGVSARVRTATVDGDPESEDVLIGAFDEAIETDQNANDAADPGLLDGRPE